jgi:O-antigen/teichoic acid export membrane protein
MAALAGYIFYLFLSQQFGAEKVGLFNVALTVVSLGAVAARLGLDGAIVKLGPRAVLDKSGKGFKKLIQQLFGISALTSVLLGLIVFLSKTWISELLDNQALLFPLTISAMLLMPYTLCIMLAETYRSLSNNWWFSWMQQGIVFLVMAVFGMLFGQLLGISFEQVLLLFLALIIAQMIIGLFKLPNKLKAIPTGSDQSYELKPVFILAWPMFLSGSAVLIMNWTDTLLLAYFESEYLVGIYSIAFKVASLVSLLQFAVNAVAAPMISKLYKSEDFKGMAKFIKQTSILNLLAALPTFIVFVFFGEWFLNLFGAEFGQGKEVLIILGFAHLLNAASGPVMTILNMTNYEKAARNIIISSAIGNVVFNIILIPYFGILGAAIGSATVMIAYNVAAMIAIKLKIGFWSTGLIKS